MGIGTAIVIPDVLPYLCALLGLLVLWQYYQVQIMKGEVLAVDIFDRSGIRMYVYAMPESEQVCQVCRDASGRLYLPSMVTKIDFEAMQSHCTKSDPCTGVLIGLYGAWLEARGVLEQLRASRRETELRLSPDQIRGLANGQWERSIGATTDRVSVYMLDAMYYEQINPEMAMRAYRYVIDQAREIRDMSYVVPAYLRLTELLSRFGHSEEALGVIEKFETRYGRTQRGPHSPTEKQRGLMSMRKSRLRVKERPVGPTPVAPLASTA